MWSGPYNFFFFYSGPDKCIFQPFTALFILQIEVYGQSVRQIDMRKATVCIPGIPSFEDALLNIGKAFFRFLFLRCARYKKKSDNAD